MPTSEDKKPKKKQAKYKLSASDNHQIFLDLEDGKTAEEIAEEHDFSPVQVQRAIEARMQPEPEAIAPTPENLFELAGGIQGTATMIVRKLRERPEYVDVALGQGKYSQVVNAVYKLLEAERAILEHLQAQAGFKRIEDEPSLDEVVATIQQGLEGVRQRAKRIELRDRAIEAAIDAEAVEMEDDG